MIRSTYHSKIFGVLRTPTFDLNYVGTSYNVLNFKLASHPASVHGMMRHRVKPGPLEKELLIAQI